MPLCPDCNFELDKTEYKYVCCNGDCSFSCKIEDLGKTHLSWFEKLCENKALWHKETFENYPSIISYEYYELFILLKKGQTYGAFLQLKDLFEVLIKFPTLIGVSFIYNKITRTDNENKVLMRLIDRTLSLSDWQYIAKTMLDGINLNKDILSLIEEIVNLYEENKIPKWRNDKLGHGALAFDTDKTFQKDLENKLFQIKRHLENMEHIYSDMNFYLSVENREICLKGKNRARNIDFRSGDLYFEIDRDKNKLYPYVILNDMNIYLFDSYSLKKETISMLNYSDGKKYSMKNPDIINLHKNLCRTVEDYSLSSSTEESTYSKLEEDIINKRARVRDFQNPKYLNKWLEELIEKNTKGIFLLQMERGTGKTTFSRGLDEQSIGKIELLQFSVRGYYINDSYSYKIENFKTHIIDILRQNKKGQLIITGALPVLSSEEENRRNIFAKILNFYKKEHYRHFGKEKLLVIIDGLDEIPLKEDVTIFDFIPDENLIEEGVYLLLTARTDNELSHFTSGELKNLSITDKINYERDNEGNINILKNYIKKDIRITDKKDIDFLLHKSGKRFLYLKLFKELLSSAEITDLNSLPEGVNIFEFYLKRLEELYSNKYFSNVQNILTVISSAFMPLTLNEITYLYGEEEPTFRFLANLADIGGMLQIDRTYRGNLISIGHEELRNFILENYNDKICILIDKWIKEKLSIKADKIDINSDGETYLFSFITEYLKVYRKEKDRRVYNSTFLEVISNIADKLPFTEYHIPRKIKLYTELININELIKEDELQKQIDRAKIYYKRGKAYFEIQKIEEAISDYSRAIETQNTLIVSGELTDENNLVTFYFFRGKAYFEIQNIEDSISDYNRAIEIQKKLMVKGKLTDENNLARSYVFRGEAYVEKQSIEEAISDYNRAIEIQKKLKNDNKLDDEGRDSTKLL